MQTLVNSMEPKALISLMRKPTIQGSLSPGAALGHTPMSQPGLGEVPETISYYFMTAAPLSMVSMWPCHIAPAHKIARTSLFRRVRKGNVSTVFTSCLSSVRHSESIEALHQNIPLGQDRSRSLSG